jgi:hypothetical protein
MTQKDLEHTFSFCLRQIEKDGNVSTDMLVRLYRALEVFDPARRHDPKMDKLRELVSFLRGGGAQNEYNNTLIELYTTIEAH